MSVSTSAPTSTANNLRTQACTRFPCDAAHRGRAHQLDEEGHIEHSVSVDRGRGSNLQTTWSVAVVAREREPWDVALSVPGGRRVITDVNELARLARAMTTALELCTQENLKEARQEADDLKELLSDENHRSAALGDE